MSIRLLIAGAAIGALASFSAAAQPYPPPPPDYGPAYGPADVGNPADTAYQEPPPETAPIYVPGRSYYHGFVSPEDTSPAADYAIRLPSYVDPTSGVTAAPNPNNVSDQVPTRGPDVDGVPPYAPY